MSEHSNGHDLTGLEVAIVAMAGRFPGAQDLEAFWQALLAGTEAVRRFSAEELKADGVDPTQLDDPAFVPAGAVLDAVEYFDAAFFGYTPREAEVLDPQQRLFLELAWEALERAGYDAEQDPRAVGVYAGAKFNNYLFNLLSHPDVLTEIGMHQAMVASDKDYLSTRASYKLGLTGPSVGVQTACSTSLVAVHLACQGLLAGECDLALAGGVSLSLPQRAGYQYAAGGIMSPDGRCRPFDAASNGTVGGNGLGIVVLKRLADALEDGDTIRAVIRATAINNDGSRKVGFTAPSVDGQAKVLRAALELAEVDASAVTYVEAHGTGTALGDSVEIAALNRTFRRNTNEVGFCGLGSVKSNIGHLDPAAGIAGLIKAALMVERGKLPRTVHFESPNPTLGLEASPFYVVGETRDWQPPDDLPRRAGVSSFGIGGTNSHAILEEPPAREPSGPSRPSQLLLLSARTSTALDAASERLADDLESFAQGPRAAEELADTAWTLQIGRRRFSHRRMLVARSPQEAATILKQQDPERLFSRRQEPLDRPLAFLFPGQGAQYPLMGRELYLSETIFRRTIDQASEILRDRFDLRAALYGEDPQTVPSSETHEQMSASLRDTALAQPALFAVEVAMARLLLSWGLEPELMLGHSVGEYVAAHLAGVFSFEDGLLLVAERGRLMQSMPPGSMLGVSLAEETLRQELDAEQQLSVAVINGPEEAVVAGPTDLVERFAERLSEQGVRHRRLHTSHAFHSSQMDAALKPFARVLAGIELKRPERRFFSNLSGELIRDEEATSAEYWVRHLRETVRFGPSLAKLWQEPNRILLEVGPGRALTTLAKRHPTRNQEGLAWNTLPAPSQTAPSALEKAPSALETVLTTLGRLWMAGVQPDWQAFIGEERRHRRELPTYPFERKRFWLDRRQQPTVTAEPVQAVVAGEPSAESSHVETRRENNRPDLDIAYLAPRDEIEAKITEVWERLLGIRPIGVHDDFFELGGGSLLATQLTARLCSTLNTELAMGELLDHPSVAKLATFLDDRLRSAKPASVSTPLELIVPDPDNLHEPFPLTEVQQAYWIGRGEGLDLGKVATHYYMEWEIAGLDVERFERALQRTIERQHMLRAIFLPDGQQQILAEVPPYRVHVLELSHLPVVEAEKMALALREEMSHQVHASDTWPLFEVRASRLEPNRLRLHISFDFLLGDAWSMQLLLAELGRFYLDPEAPAEAFELSFRDYVLAEEKLRRGELYRRSLDYWRERLLTLPSGPELPLAHDITEINKPRFVRRAAELDATTWERLKKRCARHGLTPSAVLATAFAEVLARWSAKPNFTLSLTLFNRQPLHPQVDALIGDFTSLVLLECDGRGGRFVDRAKRLQSRLWRDLDHRFLSGVGVVRELTRAQGRAGGMNLPVVFTSLLGLEPPTAETEAEAQEKRGGLLASEDGVREIFSISQTPQVLLDHQVSESPNGLHFNWDAVEQVYPEGLLDDLFATYCQLLRDLATEEQDSSEGAWHRSEALLLPTAQRDLMRGVNRTGEPLSDTPLHQLFARQAKVRPDAIAVLDDDLALSYGELSLQMQALAGRLRALGARRGDRVAVVLEKGWQQAVAVLAILETGSAYLPAEPAQPAERLASLLEQGGVRLAITRQELRQTLTWPKDVEPMPLKPLVNGERLALREETSTIKADVLTEVAPNDLAYIIFTSGSTGKPKGVAIEHRGAANTLIDINRRFDIGPDDRVLALSALNFDLSVYDLFGIWAAGGCTVFPQPWTVPDPQAWADLAERSRVTLWNSVPALLDMVVETLSGRATSFRAPLRQVLLSGDWIPVQLPERFKALVPEAEIMSLGGATEASIWSIFHPIEEADRQRSSIPYGKAMVAQTFHVLDRQLAPCPLWVPGDLYIGGVGLAREYWHAPRLTAEAFVPDHGVGPEPRGGRLYRTGDRGRLLPNGEIEFLGREDHQIKIRGHRIELGEIEAALAQHPNVEQAVVAAIGDRRDRRLVAFYVPRAEDPGVAAVEKFVKSKVPSYMVPGAWVKLDEIPLTANGKVDRGRLTRELAGEAEAVTSDDTLQVTATNSPIEALLCTLCAEVLSVDQVTPEDNFFSLGGHSLLATQLLTRVREAIGVELPLRRLFEEPSMGRLARAIENARRQNARLDLPPIERLPRDDRGLPLSFPQQRLYFLKQLAPESPVYNVHFAVRISGALQVEALRQSVEAIVHRHEALRTVFTAEQGRPRQIILEPGPVPFPRVDLETLTKADREAELERQTAQDLAATFDLTQPLWRARLFRFSDDDHQLFFMTHHIVWDDWSEGLFWRELGLLYGAFLEDQPSPLPPLDIQYADYASWQLEWLAGEVREHQLSYWRDKLDDAPRLLELPTDRQRPAEQSFDGATEVLLLDAERVKAVERFARAHGATRYMVLLAVYKTLLYRVTGQNDIVIGTLTGNRNRPEIEGLIGFFINTLALRTRLHRGPSFLEAVARVRETALDGFDHQDLPFEQLIEELRLPRDLGYTPLTQVVFNFFTAERGKASLPGLTFEPIGHDPGWAPFDLSLTVSALESMLVCDFQYASDLFDRTSILRLSRHFRHLLDASLAHPELAIEALPMLEASEQHQLSVEWNETQRDYPSETPIHHLFEAIAAQNGDAIALESIQDRWSYADLNVAADQLATRLRDNGIGVESRVGLLVERSARTVVTMLAILKAGGAYVPFDLAYPASRIRFMIEDSSTALILFEDATRSLLPEDLAIPSLDLDSLTTSENPRAALESPHVPGDALAYIMYTSGSTGTPKGAAICHRAVVRLVRETNYIRFDASSRTGQAANSAFDAATFEIWGPLLNGGTVVLLDREVTLSPEGLANALEAAQVTELFLTTSLFNAVVRERPRAFAALKSLLVGGEAVDPRWPRQLLEMGEDGPDRLFNVYGPTESTTFATWHHMREIPESMGTVPIGRPLANTRALVLDRTARRVPIGVTGQLHLGGDGLARGYFNRPALTAERFLPDPTACAPAQAGERLYATGDLVRMAAPGTIEFVGRVDAQVKIRGFRIELGEIEARLSEHPNISAVVVMAVESSEAGQSRQLMAWLAGDLEADEARAFLREKLPDYMIPSRFVFLDTMPLNANGKVDRKALDLPTESAASHNADQVAPRNEVEAAMAEIWSQVLRIPSVGVHDNFFELGGDSILTIQISARAHELGLELSPSHFFQHQTIAELATLVGGTSLSETDEGIVGPLPLTPIQRWFFDLDLKTREHFNHAFLLRAPEDFDTGWLRRAVARLFEQHDALRLAFEPAGTPSEKASAEGASAEGVSAEAAWHQVGRAWDAEFQVPVLDVDLSALPTSVARQELERITAQLQLGFDLRRGYLFRAAVIRLGDFRRDDREAPRLFFAVHHLVVDAVSWRLLLDQLHRLYERRDEDRPRLAAPATSFGRWAVEIEKQVRSGALDAHLDRWLELGSAEVADLPVEHPSAPDLAGQASTVNERLSVDLTRGLLQELPAVHGSTIERALLGALRRVLVPWCGGALRVDLEAHGRDEFAGLDPSRTAGWFTSLYPVTLPGDAEPEDWPTTLAIIDRAFDALPPNSSWGLLRFLHPRGDQLAELPRAGIGFNYLGQFEATLPAESPFQPASESLGATQDPAGKRPHELEILASVVDGQLEIQFEYGAERFDRATIERLAKDFTRNLDDLITAAREQAAEAVKAADFTAVELTSDELDSILSQLS